MGSSIPTLRAALVSVIETALAAETEVLVSYGHPGPVDAADIVAVMASEPDEPQTIGPMRTTPHTREESVRTTVTVSCWRGGGREVQQTVTERAFTLVALIESALRADVTLSGTVRMAQVVGVALFDATDPETLANGRVSEVEMSIRTQARI